MKRLREVRDVKQSTPACRHGPQIIVATAADPTAADTADTPPSESPTAPTKRGHPVFNNIKNEDGFLGANSSTANTDQYDEHDGDLIRISEGQTEAAEADAWDKVRHTERDDEVLQGFLAHQAKEAYSPLGKRSERKRRACDADGGAERRAGLGTVTAGSEWGLKVLW